MTKADLKLCLTDPHYPELSRELTNKYKFAPHKVRYSRRDERLVVLVVKSKIGNDYSLNADALEAACQFQNSGRVRQAYIGQVNPDNPRELIDVETALNVRRNLNGEPPRQGDYGPYWYITENEFRVKGSRAPVWSEDVFEFESRPRRAASAGSSRMPWED